MIARNPGSLSLKVEDLCLLEEFQINYLPGWIPEREFAAVLWAHPLIKSVMLKKCPDIEDFIERIMDQFGPVASNSELLSYSKKVVNTISDMLGYNVAPEIYDAQEFHCWDFCEVTNIVSLIGKTVFDIGSGTGRVALEAAEHADIVFAVEPVQRLRRFIRDKSIYLGLENVFVVDGFGHSIPFPNRFADVLITSHALGWHLDKELAEFERVIRPGGFIIHCPGTGDWEGDRKQHERLIGPSWSYEFARYREADGPKRKYWKQVCFDSDTKI